MSRSSAALRRTQILSHHISTSETAAVALQGPKTPINLVLHSTEELNHNSFKMRFKLPVERDLGLAVGQHVILQVPDETERGGVLKRKYTPTSIDGEIPGFTDIIVKTYNPGHTHNGVSYDGGGKMGMLLAQMKPGDSIECMGPTGELSYEGEGNFTINRKTGVVKKQVEHLLLVAGGTGITPPLQIMRSTLRDLEMDGVASNTKISLIFANQSPDDIFAADEIERAAAALGSNFRAVHVLEHGDLPQATSDITYAKGTVTKAMLKASLKSAAASTLALVVGPRGMVSEVVGLLDKLGMDKVYKKHTQAVYTLDGAYEDDGW